MSRLHVFGTRQLDLLAMIGARQPIDHGGTMFKRMSALLAALTIAGLVITLAGSHAVAQRLIGSKDVADNALKGQDIKDNSLTGKDVKNGSLTAADIKGGLPNGSQGPRGPRGEQGAVGQQGPKGDVGPAGRAAPDETVRWNVTYTSDGTTNGETVVATSNEQIARFTELKPISFEIDGDFGGCRYPYVYLDRGDQNLAGAQGDDLYYVYADEGVALEGGPLTLRAYCENHSGEHLPIPTFTASIILQITRLDSTVTRQFN